jgi:predicted nuclease of predicted toxin-antitoxin system
LGGDGPQDPGGAEILAKAQAEGRVLVTLDKDFGELTVGRRNPHAGIVRLAGFRAIDQATATLAVLGRYEADLAAGALITVEPGRVRIRPRDDDWP